MPTRREFLASSLAFAVYPYAGAASPAPVYVNDIHSQLNRTRVDRIVSPRSLRDLQAALFTAKKTGKAISVAGGRHAMGGQQFGTDTIFIDSRSMNRILQFDQERGTIEIEAGIQWPQLIEGYIAMQKGRPRQWGIAQKQTGADRLCIGGSISANAHGRGLTLKPLIADVESLMLVDADGNAERCSRTENRELFGLVNGGYGLFGLIASATLRLTPRRKVERVVEIRTADDLIPAFNQRIADGFLYGDFQFRSIRIPKTFCAKAFSRVIARSRRIRASRKAPRSFRTRAGECSCNLPTPTRAKLSTRTPSTIFRPTGSCTGLIRTSSAFIPTTITGRS